jgi:hypothetical protein
MKLKKAIKILKYHNKWRIGKHQEARYKPAQITEAIDRVLKCRLIFDKAKLKH